MFNSFYDVLVALIKQRKLILWMTLSFTVFCGSDQFNYTSEV